MKYCLLFLTFCIVLESKSQTSDSAVVSSDSSYYDNSYSTIDTSTVVKRNFSQSKLEELKNDPDFNYKEPPTVAESLWERLLQWLAYLLNTLIEGATTTALGRLIMYALGIALIIAIIMMLLKVDAVRVFFSGADRGTASYQVLHENIHEMDFEKLIREAVDKNDLRMGTRLVFLYALKILSDKQTIHWIPGKTNHDYVEEITRTDLKTDLNELSFYFDYAWYGNFPITSEAFQKVDSALQNLKSKI